MLKEVVKHLSNGVLDEMLDELNYQELRTLQNAIMYRIVTMEATTTEEWFDEVDDGALYGEDQFGCLPIE
jgi:hypothetical protein